MTHGREWLLGLRAVSGALALLALVFDSLIPSEEELARSLAARLESSLGVPVSIDNVATGQALPCRNCRCATSGARMRPRLRPGPVFRAFSPSMTFRWRSLLFRA